MTKEKIRLPKGWQQVQLEAACEIIMGQSPEGISYNVDGIGEPLLNGPTEFGFLHPTPAQWTTEPTRFAECGDILLCVRGATTGRKNVADQRYCIGRGLAAIRGRSQMAESRFIEFVLEKIIDDLLRSSAGSTFPNLSGDKLKSTLIPLPPLTEQKRIVAILDEKLAAVERARAAAQAQLQAAQALPAAYLRAVFESEEAQEWPRYELDKACSIVAKQVDPTVPDYSVLPHVNGENIESGTLRLKNVKTAAEDGMTSGKYLFEAGDVLYSKLRPYLRKVALVDFDGLCSADMYPLKANAEVIDARFLAWSLLSEEFTAYAIDESERSRMPKLNRQQLFSWVAPVPSLNRQQAIAQLLQEKMTGIEQIVKSLQAQLETINQLPATLLNQAFTGEL